MRRVTFTVPDTIDPDDIARAMEHVTATLGLNSYTVEPQRDSYEFHVAVPLPMPDAADLDPYDPAELAEDLRKLADRVEEVDTPPTGDVWDRQGTLIGRAELFEP